MKFSFKIWLSTLSNKQRWLLACGFLAIIIISACISFSLFRQQLEPKNDVVDEQPVVDIEDSEVDLDRPTLAVLLLGYGGPGHDGGFLADAIQLVQLNFETQQITYVSIPRDLWVKLPNGTQGKINQALTLGADRSNLVQSGGKVAKKMVELVTGIEVDYFIAADFVGFKRVIGENLGGITVDVPETLRDDWYPIRGEELNPCGKTPEEIAELSATLSGFELERQFACRYEKIYFPQGINHMEGGDALAYVRSRHGSAGGDFSRSQRQQALLNGLRDKLFELEFWLNLPDIFSKLSKNITTDINLEAVEYLLPIIKLTNDYKITQGVISTENVLVSSQTSSGSFILLPKAGADNWSEVRGYVQTIIESIE